MQHVGPGGQAALTDSWALLNTGIQGAEGETQVFPGERLGPVISQFARNIGQLAD